MRILTITILLSISLGCSDEELPLKQDETKIIPTPLHVTTRPILDTDLTYYSYLKLDGGSEKAKKDAETVLLRLVEAGLVISQAWLGTSGECSDDELSYNARLVVRLLEANPNIADFDFTGDPAPASHAYPWVYWYTYGCADKLCWRYDFEPGRDVAVPQPTEAPNEYPVPDSPTTYYRPWYVWGVTGEEWRVGVEAFLKELVQEGISLKQVLVPIRQSDPCGQANWCNTDVLMIITADPETKLMQPGIMTESSNCMNVCPRTLLSYQFDEEGD